MLRRSLTIMLILCVQMMGISVPMSTASQESSGNLVSNPGMEQVVNGQPSEWTPWVYNQPGIGAIESSADIVRSGGYSVRLAFPEEHVQQASIGLSSIQMAVEPGEEYSASVYAYHSQGASELYLEFYNASHIRLDVAAAYNDELNEWNKLELSRSAPQDAVYAKLLLYLNGLTESVVYFDDASFTLSEPVLNPEIMKTLPNIGMEEVADNQPSQWVPWLYNQPGIGSIQSSTDIVRNGSHSVRLAFPGEYVQQASLGLSSAKIEVVPGVKYFASIYAYNILGASELYLEYYNENDVRIDVAAAYEDQLNEWSRIDVNRTAPTGAAYAKLLLYMNGLAASETYFDDASFGILPPEDDLVVRPFPVAETQHPRLYFTQDDLTDMRNHADDEEYSFFGKTGHELWGQLEATARSYLTESEFIITYTSTTTVHYPLPPVRPEPRANPPEYTAGAYPYWTNMSHAIQSRLEILSLAYAMTEEQPFADRAKEYLLALAEWDTWTDPSYACGDGGSVCIDTAHLVFGASFAYDILYSVLTEEEREQVRAALELKGLIWLYNDLSNSLDTNALALRASALASGASAVHGEMERSNRYLTRATDSFQRYLDLRMSSGQQEGMLYSSYSINNMIRGIDHVSRVTGVRDYIEHPFLDDFLVRWATYFLAPGGGGVANFGNSNRINLFIPTMLAINTQLDNGEAGWYLSELSTEMDAMQLFLYYNQQSRITEPNQWPKSVVLDEIGWAALRSGWDKSDTLLAFVSNDSTLGHNQYDQNSFQIATNKSWIAGDPGYPDFSPGPANDFTIRMGHSTIQVDGEGQSNKGTGILTRGMLTDSYDYVSGSAAGAYNNLTKFDRHIVHVNGDYFVMFDDLQSETAHSFDWVLYNGNLSEFYLDGEQSEFDQTQLGRDLWFRNSEASLNVKFVSEDPLPMKAALYPGAEQYGYYTKVGSGVSSTEHQFLTVLKAAPVLNDGLYQAEHLLPAYSDSGKATAVFNAANTNMLFYAASEVDDYITFEFQLAEPGDYKLSTDFIQSYLYGQVQAYVNDQPIGGVFDGYHDYVQAAQPFNHGQLALSAGTHTITYKTVGKHPNSGNYFMGIDAIKLEPIDLQNPGLENKVLEASLLSGIGATGAKVDSEDESGAYDLVIFKKGSDAYTISDVESDADQAVVNVNHEEQAIGYHLTRGTTLSKGSQSLVQSTSTLQASIMIAELEDGDYEMSGNIEASAEGVVSLYMPGEVQEVSLNGQLLDEAQYEFDQEQQLLSLQVSSGAHTIEVVSGEIIVDPGIGAPGKPILSNNNGHDTGILDGNYTIHMNMWWGTNGTIYRLYENDVLIDTQVLTGNTPYAQAAATFVSGKQNGTYRYYAELVNGNVATRSDEHIVTVTQAAPAKPVIAHNNWNEDGNFEITMNMWWGTNGAVYRLYENGVLIDTQPLTENTPNAQTSVTMIRNRSIGLYAYRAEMENSAGTTSSDVIYVNVN